MARQRAKPYSWPEASWNRGRVNSKGEHIKLFHGDAHTQSWDEFEFVALLSPPSHGRFTVQFKLQGCDRSSRKILADIRKDLNYYLIEKRERDPWAYATYHCGTSANMYGPVHWAYYPEGDLGSARMAKVIRKGREIWILKK